MDTTISSLEVLLKLRVRFPQSFDDSGEVVSLMISTASEGIKSTDSEKSSVAIALGSFPFAVASASTVMIPFVFALILLIFAIIVMLVSFVVCAVPRILVIGILKLVSDRDTSHQLGLEMIERLNVVGVRLF